MKTKTTKEIEYIIRRALWTDKKLPKAGLKMPNSIMGKMVASDDKMRSLDDIITDMPFRERPTQEDIENWEIVMLDWLPRLEPSIRDIVIKRCSGMGWKRIAFEYERSIVTMRTLFKKGLSDFVS